MKSCKKQVIEKYTNNYFPTGNKMKTSFENNMLLPNKEELIYCLKILDYLGLYNEMVSSIESVNVEDYNLTYAESLLLGSSFKKALNAKRKEKTIIENIISDEKTSEQEKKCAELLKHKLNKDMIAIQKNTYITIRTKRIPKETDDKILIFYWHLIGDILRYCANTFTNVEKKKMYEKSLQSYSYALGFTKKMKIPPSSPIMLELLVSLSVLHKDMDTDINFAIEMAAQAFRDAIQNMHLLENDEECSKTIGILGILRDNINKWCKIRGRTNVSALFEIKGENLGKYKNIMNNINT